MFYKLENALKNISRQVKVTLTSALVCGLMAHYFAITSKVTNHDDIRETCAEMNQISWGRWFLAYASDITGNISMPFNCLLGVIFLALAAVLVVEMLNVESSIMSGIIGGLMTTFPSVTFNNLYNGTADAYALDILLIVLGAYIAMKVSNKALSWVLPIIFFTLALGIYQAYLGLALALFMLAGILELAYEKEGWKKVFGNEVRYLCISVASLVLYVLVSKLLNAVTGIEMDTYQGIDKMGSIDFSKLPYQVRLAIVKPLGYYLKNDRAVHYAWFQYAFVVIVVMTIALFVIHLIKANIGKLELILCCVLTVFLPVATGFIYLEGAENIHLLLIYAFIMLPVFWLVLIDRFGSSDIKILWFEKIVEVFAGLVFSILIFSYVTLANTIYTIDFYTYEESYSYAQTVISAIRTTPGYHNDSVIYMIGTPASKGTALDELYDDDFRTRDFDGTGLDRDFNEEYSRNSFYWYYLGFTNSISYIDLDDAEKMGISQMDVFPNSDSIQAIDGDIVIRFE